MGVIEIIGAVKPLSKLLVKILELVDPKTRDWVRKRKALEWGEKYIFTNEAIKVLEGQAKFGELSFKDKRKLARLNKKLGWYRKWYFEYN